MSTAALASMAELQDRFLLHMRICNHSPRTIDYWTFTLGRFANWCDQRGLESVTEVTDTVLAAYRRSLFHWRNDKTGKPLTFATQVTYLVAVRRWFSWMADEQILPTNVAHKLELPKLEQRLPTEVLSTDEVERVMVVPDVTQPLGIRNRAMLETLYSTAVRCSELLALEVYDVEKQRAVVKVKQGKGRRDRIVPIGQRALRWLNKYTSDVRPRLVRRTESARLFVSCNGRPICRNNLSFIVRQQILKAGIRQRRGTCHLLRHTAATLMMENGADVRSLQALLGHRQLNTTMTYTHVSIRHLQEIHRRTHPAE